MLLDPPRRSLATPVLPAASAPNYIIWRDNSDAAIDYSVNKKKGRSEDQPEKF